MDYLLRLVLFRGNSLFASVTQRFICLSSIATRLADNVLPCNSLIGFSISYTAVDMCRRLYFTRANIHVTGREVGVDEINHAQWLDNGNI